MFLKHKTWNCLVESYTGIYEKFLWNKYVILPGGIQMLSVWAHSHTFDNSTYKNLQKDTHRNRKLYDDDVKNGF